MTGLIACLIIDCCKVLIRGSNIFKLYVFLINLDVIDHIHTVEFLILAR